MPADLAKLRDITDNLFFWQGLRFVPLAPTFIVAGVAWTPLWPSGVPVELGLAATAAAGVVGYRLASRYYARTMGVVYEASSEHRTRSLVKWTLVYPAMVGSLLVDALLEPPFLASGVVWAVAILGYWWSTGGRRYHYLPISLATACLTLLPLAGVVSTGKPAVALLYLWLGLIYLVAGILDHAELMRSMSPERNASAV
jgi:hypothetical protein